ncbi:MAG: serine/threonine-protein kinase [Acidobacteria bacterium]|nr:serine/threonine-protein kinase [Acidobacteriota bacterium]MCA1641260.1 serine/threonine-protein kinase [Acidobacteriota bacterium]
MKAERLRQVSPIFRRAVELPPGERADFLDGACGGDAALRRDVEQLLSADERAGTFIEAPAYERAVGLLTDGPATSVAGRLIGHYRIVAPLGKGGMGEVYLARDTKLERSVALKVLPSDVASNEERMRRFTQEAKAAAGLNHPNIAHVYEIGESDGTHFIAMEYIDGVTLKEKIHREKTPPGKLLKYLTQVAEGLAKAHAAGIVHRDLKPDNIMIARDDYAKVLDFGLAKLVEPQRASGEAATAILAQHSAPGMIMGTAGYMSPEQAQGRVREIDHRSDIFSFGCILFEAATGRKAFEGKDQLDSLHKIVHEPTPQVTDVNPSAPDELQRIVRRCLAKEPDKRYQSIKDVAIELDELRQELKDRGESDLFVQPSSNGEESAAGARDAKTDGTRQTTAGAAQTEVAHSASSAEYLVSGIKSHKAGVFLALIGVAVTIAAGLGLYKYYWSRPAKPAPFREMRLTKLTFNGKAISAVISPDGKQVVYVIEDGGRRNLWLRQVATGTDVKLNEPENVGYFGMTISPDGNFLYYADGGMGTENRVLYRMPVLGDSPRKVVENVSSPIGFSPDGKQIAFARIWQGESALIIANADGTEEREIAVRHGRGSRFGNFFYGGVAWSPDGKRIATIARAVDSAGRFQNVIEVPVEGGAERPLTSQRWYQIQRLAWLSDGSGLLLTAAEKASDARARQIWHLSYPDGSARKITNELNNYGNISLNADSSVLVTVQDNQSANIWVAPDGDASRATQFTSVSGNLDGGDGVRWTPDGKIVFNSMAGGKDGIWIMEADGKNRRQLSTAETVDYNPSVSTDGRYVVFASERTGAPTVWRMAIDGSNPKMLDKGGGSQPVAGDGWVVYSGRSDLWKMPIDGGEPVKLSEGNLVRCAVSQDGKMVACSLETPGSPARLAVLPSEGGTPVKVFDVNFHRPAHMRWTPDGRSVTYVGRQDGLADIWGQSLDGGEPKRLTNFKADAIFSFDWSRDNKLAISHGTSTSDVVLIRNAK